jgi:TolB-like protein/DNA-binding winged helix-turn-helix (wHTH) protein/Tfp pilus assembly protein PilF
MRQALNAVADCLKIGEWTFHVGSHELSRNGKTIRLEPRVASLLLYLATRPGKPVNRMTLLEALWPGVVVSDEVLTNAINKLRRAFGDDRANPQVIETIPKAGYRLLLPVQAQEPGSEPAASAPGSQALGRGDNATLRWRVALAVVAVVGLAVAIITALHLAGPASPGHEPAKQVTGTIALRPSLAVLPFYNLGAEPDQEYFANGVTDDLITRLGSNAGLMVIARDSTFFYKGESQDAREIARKLNVDYVLRGNIRRDGEVLKLNAWLVDGATGAQVWVGQYEREVGQIFNILSEMSREVTRALAMTGTAQPVTETQTDNPQAYDELLLGKQHFYRFENRAENLKARAYFERAVELDPKFAAARAMLAWTYAFAAMNGWSEDRPAALRQAEQIATRAIEIEPKLPVAYFVRGLSYREQHEYIKALVEAQKAIEYDPSYANAYVLLATLLYYAGRPEEGLERIQQAMLINPHHPYNYHFHLGQAYFVLHRYREAIDALNHGLSSYPASERMRVWLAAALAQSGNTGEAQWEGEQIMAANPDFTIERITQSFPFKNPADMEHFVAGLRLAGLK